MSTVLVVDDEARIRDVLRYALQREGYTVLDASNGEQALQIVASREVDLLVLDVLMPELDGLTTCRKLRESSALPVIFLTSRSEEVDRINGLDLGADDYVTKPFSPRELVSRVRAVLRRSQAATAPTPGQEPLVTTEKVVQLGALMLDPNRYEVKQGTQPLSLTATEFALLYALATRPGRLLSRGQLLDLAYGADVHVNERSVDSHIKRIRAKLRAAGADPIETVHGLGYKLCEVKA